MLLHRCASCGRETPSLTALDPICGRCGHGLAADVTTEPARLPMGIAAAVLALLTAPLALDAARIGWEHGGPVAGAAGFVFAAGAVFVALTPQRR